MTERIPGNIAGDRASDDKPNEKSFTNQYIRKNQATTSRVSLVFAYPFAVILPVFPTQEMVNGAREPWRIALSS